MIVSRRQFTAGLIGHFPIISLGEAKCQALPSPDSTDMLQGLIDAAGEGGEAVIPPGVWHFRHLVVRRRALRLRGNGPDTILRHSNPEANAIVIQAPGVSLSDFRIEGSADAPRHSRFAIFTAAGDPTAGLRIERLIFSGTDRRHGFTNAIKLDDGADRSVVRECRFEQLIGASSGFGYGILCGAVSQGLIERNRAEGRMGRGRHFVYLSAGASHCIVRDNDSLGFDFEAMTIYALDEQPPARGNLISGNRILRPAQAGGAGIGAISIFRNAQANTLRDNIIIESRGSGIVLNGTGTSDFRDNHVINNQVLDSAYIGIDVTSLQGGSLIANEIRESSRAEPGVHSNIRLVSDGVHPVRDLVVERNRSWGERYARSPFQINRTLPQPIRLRLNDNDFRRGSLTGPELNGLRV